jgi:hypothetical protein
MGDTSTLIVRYVSFLGITSTSSITMYQPSISGVLNSHPYPHDFKGILLVFEQVSLKLLNLRNNDDPVSGKVRKQLITPSKNNARN